MCCEKDRPYFVRRKQRTNKWREGGAQARRAYTLWGYILMFNFRCCIAIQRIENQRLLDIVSDVISAYRVRARVCTLN